MDRESAGGTAPETRKRREARGFADVTDAYYPPIRRKALPAIVVAVALLSLSKALASPMGSRVHQGMAMAWLLCLLLLYCGGVLMYLRWRLTREVASAWLAAAAIGCGSYLLGAAVRLDVERPTRDVLGPRSADLLLSLILLVLLRAAARESRPSLRVGPFGLGLLIACIGLGAQELAAVHGPLVYPTPHQTQAVHLAVEVGIGVVGLLCAVSVATVGGFSVPVRNQLVIAVVLATSSRLVTPDSLNPGARSVIGVSLAVVAAAVFVREAALMLGRARSQVDEVARVALISVEDAGRADQLHELRASLAGVASAVRLLARDDTQVSGTRRTRLNTMLEAEVNRLERLLAEGVAEPLEERVLDDLLEPVVTLRRLSGQEVYWRPSGLRAVCSPDAIVEAINILLVNAAEHAPGSSVHLTTTKHGDSVRIRVRDEGPGVAQALRYALFVRGVRGSSSRGQGIGLNLAHRLVTAQGGSLRLVDGGSTGGATFEVSLSVRCGESSDGRTTSNQDRVGGGSLPLCRVARSGAPD